MLRKAARKLIYDFDDALFHRDSYSPKGPLSWTRLAHFWATIYAADAVIAGNGFLRAEASTYVTPENVHWIPTCVNPQLYPLAQHERRTSGIRLVWIGQRSTLPGLEFAEPLLAAAAERLPDLELRVICNKYPELSSVRVVPRPWSSATEAQEIAAADIGISWLPDDPWSQGKCGLKVLQYMAAGLPVVANPVGMNREMVLHGQTGFLATTREEWAEAVATLAADPAACPDGSGRPRNGRTALQRRALGPAFRRVGRQPGPRPVSPPARTRKPGRLRLESPIPCSAHGLGRRLVAAAADAPRLHRHDRATDRPAGTQLDRLRPVDDLQQLSLAAASPPARRPRVQRGELLSKLNLPPLDEPIHVYLFETEEKFDDFLRAQPSGVSPAAGLLCRERHAAGRVCQWGERVAEDLRHEVAHGYLHSVIRNMPLWLDEGIAEYCEVPRGTGGVNHPHVQLLLARLQQQGWQPNLPRLEQLNSAGSMTQDDYAESWAWAHWLLETDPRRRALLQQYLQALRTTARPCRSHWPCGNRTPTPTSCSSSTCVRWRRSRKSNCGYQCDGRQRAARCSNRAARR